MVVVSIMQYMPEGRLGGSMTKVSGQNPRVTLLGVATPVTAGRSSAGSPLSTVAVD
jgi:hypothetical protein